MAATTTRLATTSATGWGIEEARGTKMSEPRHQENSVSRAVEESEPCRKEDRGMEQQSVKRVLVYGATGVQTSPVTRRLLVDRCGVRLLMRGPGSAGIERLREAGAEIVTGACARRETQLP